jgi:ABC-2 type transport system permease protein
MKELVTLVRREFWEHRALVLGPAILCVLYLVLCLLVGTRLTPSWFFVDGIEPAGDNSPVHPVYYLTLNVVFTLLLYGLMGVIGLFYLCDCLYSERKDRSILFWKSMPVSDSMTVLSKLLVGLIGVPLVAYGFALVTNVLAFLVFKVTLDHGGAVGSSSTGHWIVLDWLQLEALLLTDVFILALWYAPIAAYQMLVSVAVPRSAMVWTVLPPLVLIFGQKLLFNSWTIAYFTGDRLGTVVARLPSRDVGGVAGLLDKASLISLLTFPSLWIGVAVAALMLYVTIRIRRHRDDT